MVAPPRWAVDPGAPGRWPRRARLLVRRDFLAVRDSGRKVSGPSFTAWVVARAEGECRIGLTVSRKVGNAVVRNRVKRHLREAFRRERHRLPPGDLVCIVRPSAADAGWGELSREVVRVVSILSGPGKNSGRAERVT